MPERFREEKEGRIAYEKVVLTIMMKISADSQRGSFRTAYLAMRDLYNSLIKRHRELWLDAIEDNHERGGRVSKETAERMLCPPRAFDHYLDPDLKHLHWMELRRSWSDACQSAGLFFISREVEIGRE